MGTHCFKSKNGDLRLMMRYRILCDDEIPNSLIIDCCFLPLLSPCKVTEFDSLQLCLSRGSASESFYSVTNK